MRVYTGGGVEEERKTGMAPALAEMAMMPTMTMSSKVEEAGRLPSIEMEPKTLTLGQIKHAREAALFVVNTKTEAEAVRIFTAGLKPVQTNNVRNNKSSSVDSSDDDVDLDGCFLDGGGSNKDDRRRERRTSSVDIRDVATAPF